MAYPAYTIRMLAGPIDSTHTLASPPVPAGSRWVVTNVIFACTTGVTSAEFLIQIPGLCYITGIPATTSGSVTTQPTHAVLEPGEHMEAVLNGAGAYGTVMVTGFQFSLT